ncbi:aminopeptidase N-like [Scaptodrosophila lebanonensis]|uniref:Aminopeptidase n=1 Tax=Drosophila lebanonensis TaxID=7225 RepID=A0A6J2T673_DROLE|nr:aminopeptidase N-like [Scaptodrosophila lebanonensis]
MAISMQLLVLLLTFLVAATAVSYNHYRLPTSLRPQKYNLRVLTQLEDPANLRFEGDVTILIEALEDTKNITLHAKNLTIDESLIKLREINGDRQICIASTEVNTVHDFYIMHTCQELLAGSTFELTLPFNSELNRQLEGYYRSSYQDANETRWLSITQFEPASARLAFPCFDEPNFKAPFVVTLGYHKKYIGLSNMPVKETKTHESIADYVWCEFEESVPMSTYLVAYSVNDFSHKPSTLPNSTLFRTWARPNAIQQCDYAAEFGPQVLNYYEELFGIKFPLPKIDQIAIPDFSAGAMENWGLVTYREIALLHSDAHSSLVDKQRVASVIAHELAHQWFGNLVTMKWWTDLWLNEGFATYVASLGVEKINPEWRYLEKESLNNLLTIFRKDALESSHPISRPIQEVAEISESFDSISYQKGSTVLRMMHMFLGEDSFRSGLQSYLQEYSYNNADQDNLWESLTEAAHKYRALPKSYDIKSIMDSWTLQTGYPVINVTRNYKANSAKLSQERYFLNTQISRAHRNNCWWVPLSYTSQSESDFQNTAPKAWLECGKAGETLPKTIENMPNENEWVIFNTQVTSLYKVNYDEQNWKLLIETLTNGEFERIHVINRAQLINDALYLAWTGEQDYEIAMRLIEYLQREREYLPWKSAFENLKRVGRIVRQTPDFEFFKRYMRKLITPIYLHLGGLNDTFASIEQQDDILLKTLVANWACQYQVEDCVPHAQEYFREWRESPNPDETNPVPINLRNTVYCTSVRNGNEDDWQFLWTRYKKSNVAAEKRSILTSLGCSREVWLLQRFLELAYDPTDAIRKQDSMWAFQAVASNEIGFHLAKNYFMANVDSLYKFYHPITKDMSRLLPPLSEQIISQSDFDNFKAFIKENRKSLKGLDQALQQTLETILTNVQWKERNYHQLTRSIQLLL